MACDVTADEPTQVRITVARSVSGIPPRVTQSGETRALAEDPRIRQVYMGI